MDYRQHYYPPQQQQQQPRYYADDVGIVGEDDYSPPPLTTSTAVGGGSNAGPGDELAAQLSRHRDLERGLERMERTSHRRDDLAGPILAQVVMEECREAKIRKQNKQVAISVGLSIGLIVAVIWFVVSR